MRQWINSRTVLLLAVGILMALGVGARGASADGPVVVTDGYASWVEGTEPVKPAKGTAGQANITNWEPYFLPGQSATPEGKVIGKPYAIAYSNPKLPVQSSDWWSGVGLQWEGWVMGVDKANPVIRTAAFVSEPFQYDFIDLPESKTVPGLSLPVQGLRLWNPADMRIYTESSNTTGNFFGRGAIADQRSPVLTVGLKNVHPISNTTPDVSTAPPWTNVLIQSYSDWGVVMTYATRKNLMTITMANGSPFTWFERTNGGAPFRVWAGGDTTDEGSKLRVWRNQNGVLGVTVTTAYVPPGPKPGVRQSTAAYAVYADTGSWTEEKSTLAAAPMSLFSNDDATKVVVAALPHNLDLNNDAALNAALTDFETYAWQRTTGTQVHFPPIANSQKNVMISGQGKPLGYDPTDSVIRSMLAITTENFKTGGDGGTGMQVVFPHHRKAMIAQDKANIPTTGGQPKYTWRSPKGELQAYIGNSYVRELKTYGMLPFLPSIAVNSTTQVNGILPAQDIYETMRTWFYKEEPATVGRNGSFARNPGAYFTYGGNTYAPNLAGVFESLYIADQLSQSPNLTETDNAFGKSKKAVAGDMRNLIVDTLEELVGRWGDVYTSGYFQYNKDFSTIYGFPQGYLSVQNLSDKHFHWGYFLRSAAAIGYYDPEWLQGYLPLFNQLRLDVAKFNRSNGRYPFMRNFSPFYGHSWANGVGNGGNGNDQESTSEAVNFAAALIELGNLLGDDQWRDIGLYLYEEQVLTAEQYWFNQDADLSNKPATFYNGNWPSDFVHYTQGGKNLITPLIGTIFQTYTQRGTHFGSPGFPQFANSLIIQAIPLSASNLYFGRNSEWLMNVWQEYLREGQIEPGQIAYENVLAGIQARLPGTGKDPNDPGMNGAIARVNRPHATFQAALNAQTKHWAYTLGALGLVDTSVVADTPNFGVFCKGATGANCAGGTRTFVAYNPTKGQITVHFKKASDNSEVTTLTVEASAMATEVGNGTPMVDKLSPLPGNGKRMYLRKNPGFSASCDAITQNNTANPLIREPGTFKLPAGTTSFPQDTSALADSMVCVPARPDTKGANIPADKPYQRIWKGSFSGDLVGNDKNPHTRFAIFSDESLFPGWQVDPCVQGGKDVPAGCPSAGLNAGANAFTMQFSYDFNADGKADRIEQYRNVRLVPGNTWSDANKQMDYDFDQVFPFEPPPMILGGESGSRKADFPKSIPDDKPAGITITLWGGTITGGLKAQYPVPISVNADPLTNRASWIQPPYTR